MAKDFSDKELADIKKAGQQYYGEGGAGFGEFKSDKSGADAYRNALNLGKTEEQARQAGEFAKADAKSFYYNKEGEHVYGDRPKNWYYDDALGSYVEGKDPNPYIPHDGPLSLGPGSGSGGGGPINDQPTDPNTGQPPTGQPPTGGPEEPYDPDWGDWWDGGDGMEPIIPTDPWTPPGPEGGDTSWDWELFQPGGEGSMWGGYDPNYHAFERYVPGQESPWGNPLVEGGNKEFYQQQFANALRDEQGFRVRQRDAQRAGHEAAMDRAENPDKYNAMRRKDFWGWANSGKGLKRPEVSEGAARGGDPDNPYNQGYDFNKQTTNKQILGQLGGIFNPEERKFLNREIKNQTNPDSNNWARLGNIDDFRQWMQQTERGADWQGVFEKLGTNIYGSSPMLTPAGGGPTAPRGYAKPI